MAALTEEPRNIAAGNAPVPLVESGTLAESGETPWLLLVGAGEHAFTADVVDEGSAAGTFIVEGRRNYRDSGTTGATRTLLSTTSLSDFPQTGRLSGWWEVRLRWVYSAGAANLSVSQ